ncbi:MAG: 5-bromo-4-chloroindolyl phosphate hydrolysis family protein [Oscillospiraceae bacterium]|nr:5-bromo-4-chloroindolyl phosphate hydrolysis family protein [Oscillospiraceae bacterium]
MEYHYYNGNMQTPDPNRKSGGGDSISWVLIALLFLFGIWPVGLVLLMIKLFGSSSGKKAAARQRQASEAPQVSKATEAVKNVTKTPQYGEKGAKAMRIVGIVLTIMGALALLTGIGEVLNSGDMLREALETLSYPLGFLAGGIGLLAGTWSMKRRARRFEKYLRAAGKMESVPIDFLATAAEVSERKAEQDLEIMVEKGLWGDSAYVDNSHDMLFRTQRAAADYFAAREKAKPPVQAEEGFSGMLRNIRRANDRIADPVLSQKIDRLEELTGRICKAVEENPAKREKASTFFNYFLPTTQKLLDSYADFEEAGVSGANLSEAKAKIEKTMDNIVAGFEHQLDELYRLDAMDVDSDIRVMESMLRRENSSVEADFGLGGTAVQENWEQE